MAVVVRDNASLALAGAKAPLAVGDLAVGAAAVEGVVDPGAIGGVGRGLEFGVGVAFISLSC